MISMVWIFVSLFIGFILGIAVTFLLVALDKSLIRLKSGQVIADQEEMKTIAELFDKLRKKGILKNIVDDNEEE